MIKEEPIATASFEVKKYVLPKFGLDFQVPSFVLTNADNLTVSVCAKYKQEY